MWNRVGARILSCSGKAGHSFVALIRNRDYCSSLQLILSFHVYAEFKIVGISTVLSYLQCLTVKTNVNFTRFEMCMQIKGGSIIH